MNTSIAWGIGLATITDSGRTLDVWYPQPQLGKMPDGGEKELLESLSKLETKDSARGTHTSVVRCVSDLEDQPSSTADAYLRLHLLSCRLKEPNTINLDGILSRLTSVAWTSVGPCSPDNFEETRYRLRAKYGHQVQVRGVDKFPAMQDYVVPEGVRIASGATVRLGAYLASGTTVTDVAFVNYNAGTLGSSTVEGRIAQGVTVGEGTNIGGGASTMGRLAAGSGERVRLGRYCMLGANSGLGIPVGDNCVVEAGLYLTGNTQVTLMSSGGVVPGASGRFIDPPSIPAWRLTGASNVLFRRNSQNGRVEALARNGQPILLPDGTIAQ